MASLADLQADLEELNALRATAKRQRAWRALDAEITTLQTEIEKLRRTQEASAPSTGTSDRSAKIAEEISRYGWDQSDKLVTLYLTLPEGLGPDDQITNDLKCTENSVVLLLRSPNKWLKLSVGPLFSTIDPSGCSVKVKPGGKEATLKLKKTVSGKQWEQLKQKVDKFKAPSVDKEDPTSGLMSMMKQLYDEGDEEMKRTMAKAFYESRSGKTPSYDPATDFGTL